MTTLDTYARFLTARWGELEAEDWHAADCEQNTYSAGPCDCGVPALTSADLAAKRTVLAHVTMQPPFRAHGDTEVRAPWYVVTLAEPFRDHPDHPANQRPA